jgi:hypothetical protein
MGFWDGLTGLFTGKPVEKAAQAGAGILNQGYQDYLARSGQGISTLQDQYYRGIGSLGSGYDAALAAYSGMGPSAFQPYAGGAQAGTQSYLDALGVNGPAGFERAQQSYIMSPGTQNAIDQAVKATTRAGTAAGGATGNIQAAAADRATKLAQQDYWGNYVGALAPFLGYGLGVAGGLDKYGMGTTQDIAGLYTGRGRDIAGFERGLGQDVASIYGNQAAGASNLASGLAGLKQQELTAGMGGAANAIGLGLNVLKLFNPFSMGTGGMGLPKTGSTNTGYLY